MRKRKSRRLVTLNRCTLLLGTALASTLLLGSLIAPTPAIAVVGDCAIDGGGQAVYINDVAPIVCVNTVDRFEAGIPYSIRLETLGAGVPITVTNTGDLTTGPVGATAYALDAYTNGNFSHVTIGNSGAITVTSTDGVVGIRGETDNLGSNVDITSSGRIEATSTTGLAAGIYGGTNGTNSAVSIESSSTIVSRGEERTFGIVGYTDDPGSDITINNSGRIDAASSGLSAYGIFASASSANSDISIVSSGDIHAAAINGDAFAIYALTFEPNSPVTVNNTGDLIATTSGAGDAHGIVVEVNSANNNDVIIHNSGDITLTATGADGKVYGIYADVYAYNSSVTIYNTGDITAIASGGGYNAAYGIYVEVGSDSHNSPITIDNTGDLIVVSNNSRAYGIYGKNIDSYSSSITIRNSGKIVVSAGGLYGKAYGIYAKGVFEAPYSPITLHNTGDITVTAGGGLNNSVYGIFADTSGDGPFSPVVIHNTGDITGLGTGTRSDAYGILVEASGANSSIDIYNSGDIVVETTASDPLRLSFGISTRGYSTNSPVTIENSGSVYAKGRSDHFVAGIFVNSLHANPTTIINSGDISASSHRAIDVDGAGTANIYNAGLITGFVDLTEQSDLFVNRSGGVFEARLRSLFGSGNDLFANEVGGTLQAATDVSMSETTRFTGLETFRNRGLISMVDGRAGDRFTISNTVGGTDLDFEGGGTLGVDAFLDGPANGHSDVFRIEGNVSGVTTVVVNNTNVGPGTFNPVGFTVVDVTGATPDPNAFQLAQPVDTGFFDYDLYFVPTNSGFWEFRSFTGAGAFLLPQLVTAAQDIWHQGSSTWFDRTADLRVLLAGGMAPTAYDPSGSKSLEAAGPYPLTPAVWARGSGSWLDRDDTARTTAYGRNYSFNLDRELTTLDFQVGLDLGQRDMWSDGDALVFGILGGFVYGDLDYDAIPRSFDFSGGQVGAYATYLNGGLFVDTLLNVHLYELSTATLGFPSSLDANTVGLRTDAGYRFGSFTGGAFLEPLATIEVTWADIDGFSLGGNRVSFDDDANVRGRLGLRAGTTMQAWEGTLMEPFVIGSVWGNLSDDNSATLVSTGRTFRFQDTLDDVWGEISGGLNFFNFSQTTAVFAKVDVTVGDDISGVGGKAGMRVNW